MARAAHSLAMRPNIAVGTDADIVLLADRPRLDIRLTMVGGEIIHCA